MYFRCPYCNAPTIPGIFTRQARWVLGHILCETVRGEEVYVSFTICLTCGSRGPHAETEEMALAKWKERAS